MSKFKKIAITGGIGSGKTTVSSILTNLGYTVYDADKLYSELLEDEDFVESIYAELSVAPVYRNGRIFFDRKKVSEVVFSDEKKLHALNALTHERVYTRIKDICKNRQNDEPLFFEIPLLFESGMENDFDGVIIVKRDLSERIAAVKQRSGLTDEQIFERIKNQVDYDKIDACGHTLIVNDGDFDSLVEKVKDALKRLLGR